MAGKLKFPEVRIVDASAGSGKTYALAERYLELVFASTLEQNTIFLQEILAITFTNKATNEMKERILEFFKKIALDYSDSRQGKALKVMDYIIKNYDHFQVQTIDSFIKALITGCSLRLNVSSNFRIEKNYDDYMTYCFDGLLDRSAGSPEVKAKFDGFLDRWLFIENRLGWSPRQDILELMGKLFSETNQHGGSFIKSGIESDYLFKLQNKIFSGIKELRQSLPDGTHSMFIKSVDKIIENKHVDTGALSAYFTYEHEYPIKKNYGCPVEILKIFNAIKMQIAALCEAEARSKYDCYLDIFNLLLDDFIKTTSNDDVLFLSELNSKANNLFNEGNEIVPEIYYRLSTKFRHYLIDEFQDTSILQWNNLKLLVDEALSTGGSLFYVGDKKQAIYRFRGGSPGLFDEVYENFKAYNAKKVPLQHNYRSQKEIVEFNNEVFSESNLRPFFDKLKDTGVLTPEEIEEIIGVYSNVKQEFEPAKDGGYVGVQFFNVDDEEENEDVDDDNDDDGGGNDAITKTNIIGTIKGLIGRYEKEDIAVLTRTNKDARAITGWLLEENISVESEKTLNIRENAYIKEIVSFLRFLNSPIDNLEFASFMSGDIFIKASGLSIADVRDFIFKQDKLEYLYKKFSDKYPQLWNDWLEVFFKKTGFVPLYELVISMLSRFNVLKNFRDYHGFFMTFLELIKKQEKDNGSIGSFLEYYDKMKEDDKDLNVQVSGINSVKVLTTHKAKGLEFKVVVVYLKEIYVKVGNIIDLDEKGGITLVNLRKKHINYSENLKNIYIEKYKEAFIDELNNLYVAFTRAAEELHILVPETKRKKSQVFRQLMPGIKPHTNTYERGRITSGKTKSKKTEKDLIELPVSVYEDYTGSLKNEFVDRAVLEKRAQLMEGRVFHHILSSIGNLHNKDAVKEIEVSLVKTKMAYDIEDLSVYKKTIMKLLEDEKCRQFFYIADGEVYREKEIIDVSGNTRRLDRLIIKEKEVIVIDYKSYELPEALQVQQVQTYMCLLKEIYPARKVKGYLVFLYTGEMKEING